MRGSPLRPGLTLSTDSPAAPTDYGGRSRRLRHVPSLPRLRSWGSGCFHCPVFLLASRPPHSAESPARRAALGTLGLGRAGRRQLPACLLPLRSRSVPPVADRGLETGGSSLFSGRVVEGAQDPLRGFSLYRFALQTQLLCVLGGSWSTGRRLWGGGCGCPSSLLRRGPRETGGCRAGGTKASIAAGMAGGRG